MTPLLDRRTRWTPSCSNPFILVAGGLQAAGNSMNARLRVALVNPWLAAVVSFALIVFVVATLLLVMPTPPPSLADLGAMPWWAPLGGIAGAGAVFGGLAFADKVGAKSFNGLLITANLLTSLAIDNFRLVSHANASHQQGAGRRRRADGSGNRAHRLLLMGAVAAPGDKLEH